MNEQANDRPVVRVLDGDEVQGMWKNAMQKAAEKAGNEADRALTSLQAEEDGQALLLPSGKGLSRRAFTAVVIFAVLFFLILWGSLSKLIYQVLFAALLAAAALPICRFYEKKAVRPLAAVGAVFTLILAFAGLVGLLLPHLFGQVRFVVDEIPALLSWAQNFYRSLAQNEWFQKLGIDFSTASTDGYLSQAGAWLTEQLPKWLSGIGSAVDALSRAFLAPVLAYYFLRDRENFTYRLSLWIPLKHRKKMLTALREMRREAGGYIRGQLLVALCVALLTALGLFILGIPAWLVLGLVMGITELIPYIGPFIGGIPIVLFSLSQGISTTLWALGITIAIQQLEGMVLSPHLMSGATGLHPVYVLLLLTAGGLLFGLMGLLLALPVFVCLRGLLRVLRSEQYP